MQNTQQHADGCTMIQTKIRAVIVAFAMVLVTLGGAHAYATRNCDRPADLRINLTLKTRPIHNNCTRYLKFSNMAGESKSVAVAFTKSSRLTYEGHVTADSLAPLQTLADHNNRFYWDTKYLENHGGSTLLDVEIFTAEIDYESVDFGYETECNRYRESAAIIAYTVDKVLDDKQAVFWYRKATLGDRKGDTCGVCFVG